MEINKPMTTRNMLASTLTDYRKPVKLLKMRGDGAPALRHTQGERRPAGNTYKIQDDAWALDFYYAHKDDTAAQLVHAVLTNTQMWDQDLTKIEGLEAAVLADLEMIRTQGAEAAYKSCL